MKSNVIIKEGDIFESKMQTLVNTVNCVGVMGKGIAFGFKKRFPEMFNDYEGRCSKNQVRLGEPYLYKYDNGRWILNFPTKDHWRSVSRINDIESGLKYLIRNYRDWGIKSIAVPPLGCGQGQLEWNIVGPTLFRFLSSMDIPIELYAPFGTPRKELQLEFLVGALSDTSVQKSMARSKIEPAWVALVEVLLRIEKEPYHWPVGRTIFQKIAYLATINGLPTGLIYRKGSYGPFSDGVKDIIAKLLNNGLISEERLGRMFAVKVGRTFNDARSYYANHLDKWEVQIEQITDLCLRMNTKQAELVSTILFVTRELENEREATISELDVLNSAMEWKHRRKPPIDERELAFAIRNLSMLKWINLIPSVELNIPD